MPYFEDAKKGAEETRGVDYLKGWENGGHTKAHLQIKPPFDGHPLVAVKEDNQVTIYTNNAIKGEAMVFCRLYSEDDALRIVNCLNFYDEVLEALKQLLNRTSGFLDGKDIEAEAILDNTRNVIANALGQS